MKFHDRDVSLLGLVLVVAVAAATLLLAPAAMASRPAGPVNFRSLRGAVVRSHLVPGTIRRGHFHLKGTGTAPRPVISTAGPWAAGTIVPSRGGLDAVIAVFRRHHGHPRWTLSELGTAQVGCSRLPAAVLADLGLAC